MKMVTLPVVVVALEMVQLQQDPQVVLDHLVPVAVAEAVVDLERH